MKDRKTIVIIGGGMAGLSAGIYAEQNGFHAIILEKNPSVGGFCTGWYRKGRYIDGCVHWMTGTKENTVLYNMWKNLGAIKNQDDILYLPSWGTFEYEGTKVTLWTDLDKAEKEWLSISPSDKKMIHRFFKMVRDFISVELPLNLPMNMLSFKELMKVGFNVLPVWRSYLLSMKMSCEKFASKFKSKALQFALTHCQPGSNNLFAMLYSYATVADGDGGIPKGGSKIVAERMKQTFINLGGTLKVNTPVKEIVIKDKLAIGVKLNDDSIIHGDYVVAALDPNYTFNKLLLNQYSIRSMNRRYANPNKHPCPSGVLLSFEVNNMIDLPIPYTFMVEPFNVGYHKVDHLTIRSYAYDKDNFIKDDKTIVSVLIHQESNLYDFWRELIKDRNKYDQYKLDISNHVIDLISQKFPILNGNISLLDVATPYTMKRWCNATRGSYMGFCFTPKSSMYVNDGHIHGIKNLYMSGQWLQSPGGLPLAISEGKFAIQRICKKESLSIIFDKPINSKIKK